MIKVNMVSVCLSFTYLLFISFSLTSFRFHYLFGVIPLAPVPCGVFCGVGEGRARWSTGWGGPTEGGQHGWRGPAGGASSGGGGNGWGRTERRGASTGRGEGTGDERSGEERPGEGKLDGCIMYQVHTSESWFLNTFRAKSTGSLVHAPVKVKDYRRCAIKVDSQDHEVLSQRNQATLGYVLMWKSVAQWENNNNFFACENW